MNEAFAQDYRKLVIPQLRQRFEICAALVFSEISDFSDEHASLVSHARRLGGRFLPVPMWDDLDAWIADQLLLKITEIEMKNEIPGAHREIIQQFAALQAENAALRESLAQAFKLAAER